jgi:hypothetical protein
VLLPDGQLEEKNAIDYIYSVAEMERMLHDCGLTLKKLDSIPGRKAFSLGDPRAYLVAERSKK